MTDPPSQELRLASWTQYRRKKLSELRPYVAGESLVGVDILASDMAAGSPKAGDMIARKLDNHAVQWLVSAKCFAESFEEIA